MAFFNETNVFYTVMAGITTNITGTWFLTLLLIVFGIMALAFAFRIELELTTLIVFPLLIGFGAMDGAFAPALGVGILYIAAILAKNVFSYSFGGRA
jgi:hypothetical protein